MIDEINFNNEVKINKILVATDGSPASIKGIVHAVQMAKEKNADVIAIYVDTTFSDIDPRGYTAFRIQNEKIDINDSDIKAILNKYYEDIGKPKSLIHGEAGLEVAASVGVKQGVKVKTMVEKGREVEVILKIAEQESVDMIVMGSKGMSGLDRILLGSVADKVNKLASCPVLIIR